MKKLTAQSRGIVYLALLISGLVVFSALLYFFTARRNDGVNPQMTGVIIGIVVVAVASFAGIYYIRTRRTRFTRRLDQSYFVAYERISDILQASPLGMMERREVLNDVVSLLLQAQQDGRPVKDVVGEDVDSFMEKVQLSFGYRNRILYHIMNGIQYSIGYFFFIQAVLFFQEMGQISFFAAKADISLVALLSTAAFLAIPLMRYYIRRQKTGMVLLIPVGLMAIFIGVMEFSSAYLSHIRWIATLLDGQVALIPSWGVLFLWIGVAAAAQLIKWLQRRLSIKRLA